MKEVVENEVGTGEYSPFELRTQEIYDVFLQERGFRVYVRDEIKKLDEIHMSLLERLRNEANQRKDAAKTPEGFSVYCQKPAYRGPLEAYLNIQEEGYAYKELIKKRDKIYEEQFKNVHRFGIGVIHKKTFGNYRGENSDKKNRWQRYSSQLRIPLDSLSLRNICGRWASELDFEWIGFRLGDRPLPIQWLPRKEELARIKALATALHQGPGLPSILEIGAGTGLLSYLLAEQNDLFVVGMDPDERILLDEGKLSYLRDGKFVEISTIAYTHPNLRLIPGTSKTMLEAFSDTPPDLVVSSWMPEDINLTPDIKALNPTGIVLMYQDSEIYHRRFAKPGRYYRKAYRWQGPDQQDVLNFSRIANTTEYSAKQEIGNGNIVEIWLRKNIMDSLLPEHFQIPDEEKFPWETTTLQDLMDKFLWEIFHDNENFPRPTGRIDLAEAGLKILQTVAPMEKIT